MTLYRRRLLIVLTVIAIWFSFAFWLSFDINALHVFGQNRTLFLILVCVLIVPIGFYYILAKRWPHFAIGLGVLAGGVVLTAGCGIANLVFNFDNAWLDRILDFGQTLIFLASLIFIWQAVKKSKAEKNTH